MREATAIVNFSSPVRKSSSYFCTYFNYKCESFIEKWANKKYFVQKGLENDSPNILPTIRARQVFGTREYRHHMKATELQLLNESQLNIAQN